MELYPVKETYIGYYSEDGAITIPGAAAAEGIDNGRYSPFWTDGSVLPFLEYEGNHTFRCWSFGFFPVCGYMTKDGKNYSLVTYTEDFGFEVYDVDSSASILEPDEDEYKWYFEELPFKFGSFEHRVEQAAKRFDTEKYMAGEIITTPEQLRKFLEEVENK